jgi:DNA-binding MurR/RpiR family transcriptional regulator
MTDQWLSPVARHARHIFSARVGAPSRWDSHVGLLALAEALVAAVVERRWEEVSRRLARAETMRRDG